MSTYSKPKDPTRTNRSGTGRDLYRQRYYQLAAGNCNQRYAVVDTPLRTLTTTFSPPPTSLLKNINGLHDVIRLRPTKLDMVDQQFCDPACEFAFYIHAL